jgi:hypothetical protein
MASTFCKTLHRVRSCVWLTSAWSNMWRFAYIIVYVGRRGARIEAESIPHRYLVVVPVNFFIQHRQSFLNSVESVQGAHQAPDRL